MQQQRQHGGRAGPAQHRRRQRHRPQRRGRVDDEQHDPAGHRAGDRAGVEVVAPEGGLVGRAQLAQVGRGRRAGQRGAVEPADGGEVVGDRRRSSRGEPARGEVDHDLGARPPRRSATGSAAGRRRRSRPAGAGASRANSAAIVSRHSGCVGEDQRAADVVRPRRRGSGRATPKAPPGHILRGSSDVHLAAQQGGDRGDGLGATAPRRAPSGSPPRHTEQRPHGSAAGSSSDSCSSSIRQRSPRT